MGVGGEFGLNVSRANHGDSDIVGHQQATQPPAILKEGSFGGAVGGGPGVIKESGDGSDDGNLTIFPFLELLEDGIHGVEDPIHVHGEEPDDPLLEGLITHHRS